uniref:Nucleoplasmin-like domain-containing protein n=1 Tax=Setaria italica TaxID=4555 RepID=K4AHN4_SETIT
MHVRVPTFLLFDLVYVCSTPQLQPSISFISLSPEPIVIRVDDGDLEFEAGRSDKYKVLVTGVAKEASEE